MGIINKREVKLREYLRGKCDYYIRPFYLERCCKKCGGEKNLEMHHDKQFAEIMNEVLDELGLEYKTYKKFYSKDELKRIVDSFLGKHLQITYTTLCRSCHKKIHKTDMKIKIFLMEKKEVWVDNNDYIIYLTGSGKIYKGEIRKYKLQHRRGYGMCTEAKDWIVNSIYANAQQDIHVVTNNGKMFKVPVKDIGDLENKNIYGLKIVKILNLNHYEDVYKKDIIFLSSNGYVKRLNMTDVCDRYSPTIHCGTYDNDEIIDAVISDKNSLISIVTERGNSCLFYSKDIRNMGRTAIGVMGIDMKEGDKSVSINSFSDINDDLYILSITEYGNAKMTSIKDYNIQNRGGVGLITHRLIDKSGKVVSSKIVSRDDHIAIFNGENILITKISEISVTGRSSVGAKTIFLKNEDIVRGIEILKNNIFFINDIEYITS